MADMLTDIITRNRKGEAAAIPSVCSAHPDVLRACMMRAQVLDAPLVIEATSNQVNQDGGYTGMRAADFIGFVHELADSAGVDRGRITFGGDHLGPQAWRNLPADQAMEKARVLVRDYVAAGFRKIHLDCSQGCDGEDATLPDATCAERSADLAQVCLNACNDPETLGFVIGTEVPPPGGARMDEAGDIPATTPESAQATLAAHEAVFPQDARVLGLVVQPGVEFSPMQVHHLPMQRDPALREVMMQRPGLCLEAHSTDYQHPSVFPRLATLGFAFQKVGPALTFAWRQAIYSLDILRGLTGGPDGVLRGEMEAIMQANPGYWQGHYHGDDASLLVQRHFGLADRIRYYWPQEKAQTALAELMADLTSTPLPDPLLEQVFSRAVLNRAEALSGPRLQALIDAEVQLAMDPYFFTKGDAA